MNERIWLLFDSILSASERRRYRYARRRYQYARQRYQRERSKYAQVTRQRRQRAGVLLRQGDFDTSDRTVAAVAQSDRLPGGLQSASSPPLVPFTVWSRSECSSFASGNLIRPIISTSGGDERGAKWYVAAPPQDRRTTRPPARRQCSGWVVLGAHRTVPYHRSSQ